MTPKAKDTSLTDAAAQLRMAVVRTARRLRQEAAAEATGLTPTSTAALATIERHGPLTPSELADLERVKRPTVTRTLGCLEREGLIERTPDPADGRSALVSVNAAGRERLRRLRGRKNAYLARRMREMPDADVEALERAAQILERMLEDERQLSAALRRSFDSLAVPNYRRYFAGQLVSLSGNWMQTVAALWLVLSLTGSGVAVGLDHRPAVPADAALRRLGRAARRSLLQAAPADRHPGADGDPGHRPLRRRRGRGRGAVDGLPRGLPMGAINAVDNPTRQSFVIEMVGPDRVVNAVSLNSVIVQSARIVGPAFAGLLIAGIGVGPCFAVNALSFAAMIFALWGMNPGQLSAAPPAVREAGAIRAGLRYVRATPELAVPLALMALVGTFGFNFQVILPLLARFSFDGGAGVYAALVSAMGVGSVAGALVTGAHGRTGPRLIAGGALAFGVRRCSPRRCPRWRSRSACWPCSAPPR